MIRTALLAGLFSFAGCAHTRPAETSPFGEQVRVSVADAPSVTGELIALHDSLFILSAGSVTAIPLGSVRQVHVLRPRAIYWMGDALFLQVIPLTAVIVLEIRAQAAFVVGLATILTWVALDASEPSDVFDGPLNEKQVARIRLSARFPNGTSPDVLDAIRKGPPAHQPVVP